MLEDWRALSTEERKILTSIMNMPVSSKHIACYKRGVFISYLKSMANSGKFSEEDVINVIDIFEKRDQANCPNTKKFVIGNITEQQIDLLFKTFKCFEECITNFKKEKQFKF